MHSFLQLMLVIKLGWTLLLNLSPNSNTQPCLDFSLTTIWSTAQKLLPLLSIYIIAKCIYICIIANYTQKNIFLFVCIILYIFSSIFYLLPFLYYHSFLSSVKNRLAPYKQETLSDIKDTTLGKTQFSAL